MEIAVTFCNQPDGPGGNLLLIEPETGKKKYLLENIGGLTGLTQDEERFYAISQSSPAVFFALDKISKKVVFSQELKETSDPHQIAVHNGFVYIVSTGNDSVLRYKFDKDKKSLTFEKVFWKPKNSNGEEDTHHMNSIFVSGGKIYTSAFGSKEAEKWSSAEKGYVFNIAEDKKEIGDIYHPHSLFIENNIFSKKNIYYCESATRSVKKNNKTIIQLEKGYTRGLFLKDKFLFLGTSSGRKNSKSTNLVNNFADPGFLEEDCKLLVYKKNIFNRFSLQKTFDFFPKHKEIYAIIALT